MPIIGEALCDIINTSLGSGIVPHEWKMSTIVPVPKVKNSVKCEDFRQINMLPTYEKVLDTLVKQQIEKFAEQQKIFIDTQSGFRKRHSCEISLNTVLKEWKDGFERKNNVNAVFLDFKRAFETIVRSKLIEKLKQYGIGGVAAKWFESYLDNRRQKTRPNLQQYKMIWEFHKDPYCELCSLSCISMTLGMWFNGLT
jgi:hypothetical protein